MNDSTMKIIKTSCPFPMLCYPVTVRYNEVKKASGIAYILLELMQHSAMREENIGTLLLRFGIPADLHYLFAKELASLVATEIVEAAFDTSYIERPEYFGEMKMGYFFLTAKGKKMFAEGAIPTGEERAKKVDLFYRPATRKYEYYCQQSYAPLNTSFLGEDFLDAVDYDVSDMEDYIRSTKDKVGLKKEELVAGISYEEPKKLAVKTEDNLSIEIGRCGVRFVFESTDEQVFFKKYYSSALMSAGMLMKNKYKFPIEVPTVDFETIKADNLYIPDDVKKQAMRPCRIFLCRGRLDIGRTDNILQFENAEELLDILNPNAEFALLDLAGCKYDSPLNLRIPCKDFKDFGDVFELQMLVETTADGDLFDKLLGTILKHCYAEDLTPENGKIVLYIAEVKKNPEYLRRYATGKMAQTVTEEEKIDVLLKINAAFGKHPEWKTSFAELSEDVFNEYVEKVDLTSSLVRYSVISPLRRAMDMSDAEFIERFSKHMREKESPELVYQALESLGFNEQLILPLTNVVEPLMNALLERTRIDGTTELEQKYALLSSNLWKLCDMLGIEDLTDYSLRDDYNVDAFFNVFSTFENARKSVEKYRKYAKEQYAILDRYASVFAPVQEVLSIERTAAEHPEQITEKYIDEQIARGRFNTAVSSLFMKAQYDLRRMLSADPSLPANELIDEAKVKKVISREVADSLHKLRICRNSLQHPESRKVSFDRKMLEGWRDLVFSLKGDKK